MYLIYLSPLVPLSNSYFFGFPRWLNSNSAVLDCSADPSDEESLNMEVVITISALGKFKTYFPRVKSLLV